VVWNLLLQAGSEDPGFSRALKKRENNATNHSPERLWHSPKQFIFKMLQALGAFGQCWGLALFSGVKRKITPGRKQADSLRLNQSQAETLVYQEEYPARRLIHPSVSPAGIGIDNSCLSTSPD
jgi:hypothetical protein